MADVWRAGHRIVQVEVSPAYSLPDLWEAIGYGPCLHHLTGPSLYDALGPEFTPLRFDPAVDVRSLVAAPLKRAVSMTVLDVDADETPTLYSYKLVLSRPDQHVTWRGDEPPQDALALIDLVRGASALVLR